MFASPPPALSSPPDGTIGVPASPLPGVRVVDLRVEGEVLLQDFFEANPGYFLAVHGEPAQAGEAREEIHEALPAEFTYTRRYVFGYQDDGGRLVAMAHVISDLLAAGVWHIATFIVATDRHGSGDARTLHGSIERWARGSGADWMRLGVVEGHARAESFWHRCGYSEVTKRTGVVMGRKTNTIRVMVKPLRGGGMAEYRRLMERDRQAPDEARAAP